MTRGIYLDYASTAPLDPRVAAVMHEAMMAGYANPASQHQAGRIARRALEQAREEIGELLNVSRRGQPSDRVVFTSGGTEANNLALLGLAGRAAGRVIISAIEHPSVLGAAEELARRGFQIDRIRVSTGGVCDLNHLAELLAQSPRPRLVSMMLLNNETGVIQPIAEAAQLCHSLGVPLHTDAVQFPQFRLGKDVSHDVQPFLSATTITAHKLHGPLGIGALLLRDDAKFEPQLFGGFQQGGLRPGTESVVLAIGFREALANRQTDLDASQYDRRHTQFESMLQEQLDNIVIAGELAERLFISNIAFLGVDRQQLLMALDFAGVYCSTGSACASGSSEPSPVLQAMGLPADVVASSLRFSFGAPTTADDIEEAASRIVNCVNDLRAKKSVRK